MIEHLAVYASLLLMGATVCHSAAVVEHSLDGASFQQIGLIQLVDDLKDNQPVVSGTFERQPFTNSQLEQLQELVEQDRLYLWRVRLEGQPAVLTSIKAACLAENFLSQMPVISIDSAGHIISAQLTVPATLEGTCNVNKALQNLQQLPQDALLDPQPLNVVVNTPKAAPAVPRFPPPAEAPADPYAAAVGQARQQVHRPAGQQPQQQHEGEEGEQHGGTGQKQQPPPDTRTWWQKNWLFVMAGGTMVLNMALKAAVGDVPQQGQQGRPGAARQVAAAGRR